MPFRSCWWALLLIGLLAFTTTAGAQTAASAVLFPPKSESFPRISTFMDVHDAQMSFIHGIQASEVQIIENGRSLPVVELRELRPGVQIVLALAPAPPFGIRDSQGISRYMVIRDALLDWAKARRGSSIDDLSLLISAGPEITHFSDPTELVTALESYQPDTDNASPSLEILLRAIDVAADAPPRAGMERAVLLVTSPVEGDISFGLQELTARAAQQRVHIFVWLVGSPEAFASQPARLLFNLSEQTGGQFFTFSAHEAVPDPKDYFEQLRDIYQLAYDSRIAQGGPQELAVEIRHGDQVIASPTLTFDFDLRPPDPAFIFPSPEISRSIPAERRKNFWQPVDPADLQPDEQEIQALIDFPDGRKRPLVRTALYVDGVVVEENNVPPFDQFHWDLSAYTDSGQHILQIEAVDSLGMVGASIQVPVQVNIDLPRPNPLSTLFVHWPKLAGLAALLAVAIVLLALILSGRIRPHRIAPLGLPRRRLTRRTKAAKPEATRPQRPPVETAGRYLPNWVNRLQWPQRRLNPKAYAYLYRTDASDKPGATPISITADEITFGLDPSLATQVLEDPSVEGLHARLIRREDGSILLVDQGSVAGTWVNYAEVPEGGSVLQHGDLIHFGRVGLRFTERQPGRTRKPVITIQEPQA